MRMRSDYLLLLLFLFSSILLESRIGRASAVTDRTSASTKDPISTKIQKRQKTRDRGRGDQYNNDYDDYDDYNNYEENETDVIDRAKITTENTITHSSSTVRNYSSSRSTLPPNEVRSNHTFRESQVQQHTACEVEGSYRRSGEYWRPSACNICRCLHGQVDCARIPSCNDTSSQESEYEQRYNNTQRNTTEPRDNEINISESQRVKTYSSSYAELLIIHQM
uniref:VWFC domain-containing protein n=1 Tax=Trichogramma kaykai TaxID=54128 RepID=A0ABD2XC94_9HYME